MRPAANLSACPCAHCALAEIVIHSAGGGAFSHRSDGSARTPAEMVVAFLGAVGRATDRAAFVVEVAGDRGLAIVRDVWPEVLAR